MGFQTASHMAALWGISQRRVQILCSEGRIPGCFKLGETWAIPDNAMKPIDPRKERMKKENKQNERD